MHNLKEPELSALQKLSIVVVSVTVAWLFIFGVAYAIKMVIL